MSFRGDQRGFIFSLDATLAMLVVMIVMAGVARMGGLEQTYEQHGYLRLERYANDALEVLQLTGTLDNIVNFVKHGENGNAENLARTELRKILPAEVQFRLVIKNVEIYPSDATGWTSAFSNAEEVATAVRITPFVENRKILAWLDDGVDENFMDEVARCTGWEIYRTSNRADFWNKLNDPETEWPFQAFGYYDVVFIPDADIDLKWTYAHLDDLERFALYGGRFVVGGDTLYNCYQDYNWTYFWDALGVQYTWNPRASSGVRPTRIRGDPLDNMHIINGDNFVTAPYENCDNVEYAENYYQYIYTPKKSEWVVARWEETPIGVASPVPGIIVREGNYAGTMGWTYPEPSVLFNMNFAQSALDPNQPMGRDDWITLVRNAIGYKPRFEPLTLYVWRGSAPE